jgi:hypothetical protein
MDYDGADLPGGCENAELVLAWDHSTRTGGRSKMAKRFIQAPVVLALR